jgi:hypothetical protein
VSSDGQHYRIASAGSDNVFAWDTRKIVLTEAKEPKYSEDLGEDIVYQDGAFLQLPAITKPHVSAAPRDGAPPPVPHP